MTVCENEDTLEYTPFNDTNEPRTQQFRIGFTTAKAAMDTIQIDPYRQGVSIRNDRHRFLGMAPKLGTGHPCHFLGQKTIGQPRDFTEYENDPAWLEIPEFNPVWYIQDPNYPLPIINNQGPMEEEAAIIMPFTIPARKDSVPVASYFPRGVHANLGSGNTSVDPQGGNNVIEQCVSYDLPLTPNAFLDEGDEYHGTLLENSVHVEGFVPFVQRAIEPFNDTEDEVLVRQIQTTDPSFISALHALDYDLSEDIRGTFKKKSATAGSSVYGPEAARYGTDSIAYSGLVRGG